MKLQISPLNEGENHLSYDSSRDVWVKHLMDGIEKREGFRFQTPMGIELSLTKLEPDYYMRGKLTFTLAMPCARCVESFVLPMQHNFELAFNHVASNAARSELSEESEELDINFFSGNEIELDPVIEEQFFLSLPYQAICSEQCRGMCQQCGKNLNQEACQCAKDSSLSPFSVLKQIKP
jgi:uncharacterized protein